MKWGKIEIDWLGHASFKVVGSVVVYVDPYVLSADCPKADVILVTHDHYDHCAADNIQKLQKQDTVVVCTPAASRQVQGKTQIVTAGKSLEVKGVKIAAVAAYNIEKAFHPKGSGVGFVFTIDGTTIYHAGDTDFIPEMKSVRADIALLPIGGTFTMDSSEAAQAAMTIKPKITIPMHYGTLPQTQGDPHEFKNLVTDPHIEVRILG